MAVENDPRFPKWKAALENLLAVTEARKNGDATDAEVNEARKAYFKIADEL